MNLALALRFHQFRSKLYNKRCHATYYALGLIAWNDTCVQMGKPQCVKKVPWYKRLTANVLSWGSVASNFK